MLTGKGTGSNRISNAIEDAVLHTCRVATGYNLFSADKAIIKLIYPRNDPLMLGEIEDIIQFTEMFTGIASFMWGISERESESSDVIAQIIASNLKDS